MELGQQKINMNNHFETKDGINIEDFKKVNPKLITVWGWFVNYCAKHGLECCITSIIAPKTANSISSTHLEGRAIDARSSGFNDDQKLDCIHFMEENCGKLGAYSPDGIQRVIIHHDVGYGPHFHMQVYRGDE